MSTKPDPKRWTDALPAGDPLREALAAARAETPAPARLERVYGSIVAAGGGLGGEGGDGEGDGLDGGAGDGAEPGGHLPDHGFDAPPPIVVPPAAPVAIAGTGLGVAGASSASFATSALGKLLGVGLVGSASIATAVWIASPAPAPIESQPSRMLVRDAAPPVARERRAVDAPPTPVIPPAAVPSAVPSATTVIDDPEAEIALLREAQGAASSAPARALSLLDESERRFPRSSLAQERVVIRVQALLAAGRRDEALARARALIAANPGTAHRPRLEQLLPELTF